MLSRRLFASTFRLAGAIASPKPTKAAPRSVFEGVSPEELHQFMKKENERVLATPLYEGDLRPQLAPSSESTERLRRRLRMQAAKRGMAEMDFILGGFVDAHLDSLSHADLLDLDKVFAEPDNDLQKWILQKQTPEWVAELPIWQSIMKYVRSGDVRHAKLQ